MQKYNHVSSARRVIKKIQHAIVKIGRYGTSGALNPLCRFGCVLRSTITDKATITNVNKAPILTKLDNALKSINPAIAAPVNPAIHVEKTGA